MDFTGQVVVVTGGSRGVGRAAVQMLVVRGARVLFGYQSRHSDAATTIAGCGEAAADLVACQAGDLRHASTADALIESALTRWGRVDALIHCAGVARYAPLAQISDQQWEEVLQSNLDSAFFLCKAAMRPMMKRRYGRIVLVAALHGVAGGPGQADYSAATGAMLGFAKALAREVAPWTLTVNTILPGFVATEQLDVIPIDQREWGEQVIALRRPAQPAEVAAAALFLASPLASYITGVSLPVDGGWRMV
jgi:3-oxoacyl-[acyl-carrier protein] reductase